MCNFEENCKFDYAIRFGENCLFNFHCVFGISNSFGDSCKFGESCIFERDSTAKSGHLLLAFEGFGTVNRTIKVKMDERRK